MPVFTPVKFQACNCNSEQRKVLGEASCSGFSAHKYLRVTELGTRHSEVGYAQPMNHEALLFLFQAEIITIKLTNNSDTPVALGDESAWQDDSENPSKRPMHSPDSACVPKPKLFAMCSPFSIRRPNMKKGRKELF